MTKKNRKKKKQTKQNNKILYNYLKNLLKTYEIKMGNLQTLLSQFGYRTLILND